MQIKLLPPRSKLRSTGTVAAIVGIGKCHVDIKSDVKVAIRQGVQKVSVRSDCRLDIPRGTGSHVHNIIIVVVVITVVRAPDLILLCQSLSNLW
jgi:hypothetical protein